MLGYLTMQVLTCQDDLGYFDIVWKTRLNLSSINQDLTKIIYQFLGFASM